MASDRRLITEGSLYILPRTDAEDVSTFPRMLQLLSPGETLLLTNDPEPARQLGTRAFIWDSPAYFAGRENALSGIYFGDMDITDETGTPSLTEPVAIKPCRTGKTAYTEYQTANYLNRVGAEPHEGLSLPPVTYVPIGFQRLLDGSFATVTKFERGVRSFDNIFGHDEPPTEKQVVQALSYAAATLIFLHANGRTHGDFQIKNTAHSLDGGRVIDITTMEELPPEIGEQATETMLDDLRTYIASLNMQGDTRCVTPHLLEEYLTGPYYDCLDEICPEAAGYFIGQRATLSAHLDPI